LMKLFLGIFEGTQGHVYHLCMVPYRQLLHPYNGRRASAHLLIFTPAHYITLPPHMTSSKYSRSLMTLLQ
jgi:hypothetical protein